MICWCFWFFGWKKSLKILGSQNMFFAAACAVVIKTSMFPINPVNAWGGTGVNSVRTSSLGHEWRVCFNPVNLSCLWWQQTYSTVCLLSQTEGLSLNVAEGESWCVFISHRLWREALVAVISPSLPYSAKPTFRLGFNERGDTNMYLCATNTIAFYYLGL